MTGAARVAVDALAEPQVAWDAVAAEVRAWCAGADRPLRDLVVLLPSATMLAPARRAFAAVAGWQPRVETTRTLADSLGPPAPAGEGPSFDDPVDRLTVAALMRGLSFGRAWERRDRRGFGLAVQATVAAAQALARAAQAVPPPRRVAHWTRVRAELVPRGGPGGLEAALLRLAAEWAALGADESIDRLYALRPAGWVIVRAGGAEPLSEAVAAHDERGEWLRVDLDPAAGCESTAWAQAAAPTLILCDDQEAEARTAAGKVIEALNAGQAPVALVALDRSLVRRVRALLERAGVRLADETGWKLSTTRSAARLMAWLRASSPTSSADERLDWLKGWPPALADLPALQRLESSWRRPGRRRDDPAAAALWAQAEAALGWADGQRKRTLVAWLDDLRAALQASTEWADLASDAAGSEVLQALRLNDAGPGWRRIAEEHVLDLAGFTAWVDEVLEGTTFVPPADGAEVVLTPLARTVLRPFGAVVVPGTDAGHLGHVDAAQGLVGDALAEALGLPTRADRHRRERLAFGHLLRQPALTLIRRRLDGDEPLAISPALLAWIQARRAAGLEPPSERAWAAPMQEVASMRQARPLPRAARSLPESLSASQVEALRACPYRFFARAVLRLQEDEEIEREADKRDYGTWLHAVLHRFHVDRGPAPGDDVERLAAAARTETQAGTFDAAELLPFLASFESFAPAYLAWLAQVESEGWRWQDGESSLRAAPAALAPTGLHGRIDRIDVRGRSLRLIDYKTGSATSLMSRMKPLSEDTQLAFYAALLLAQAGPAPAELEAAYLTLDDPKAPSLLMHQGVADSAAQLLDGLGGELLRLRGGAPMPALGEGATCEHCEMRGLCRRDHWGDAP